MIGQFKQYISNFRLFTPDEPILLAISGGVDSMVMAELFHRAGFNFAIAHCNFGLRGSESNQDEVFVASIAELYGVRFYVKNFKTREYAGFNKISVQMAARTLRYEWFDELLQTEGFKAVATAHHLDDQIETFFINVLRGTGISGLHGILPNRQGIVHPMMFAFRRRIEEFASDEAIAYREDSSNRSSKYLRNKIRHDLVPLMGDINPEFRKTITSTIDRMRETEILLNNHMDEIRAKAGSFTNELSTLKISELINLQPIEVYLFELLQPFGFNRSVTDEIASGLEDISGKQYFSPTHRLLKDRENLIITPLGPAGIQPAGEILIEEENPDIKKPVQLRFNYIENHQDLVVSKNGSIAMLDASKIEWPLRLRKWKEGDTFVPYGMINHKKLSDFFIDNKFSIVEKENAWLLISGNEIVWLVGHRIGNAFRITPETETILKIEWLD
ncbi:MAG: tRNA lysidine(34) synthetase TilS [Bacteroidetes bacterium HGW-Bacteroidetes-9]|nr:MAG: tRNA lysidine(34) synthetase TilS [Bacteroidetes bacterium HGW-Bacteroidetes-9]